MTTARSSANPPRKVLAHPSFWGIVAMVVALTLIHYLTTQVRLLSPELDLFLSRHAVERIIFVLPVIAATFVFGRTGGLVTLAIVLVIMLPRVIWLSSYPLDALFETIAVGVVGRVVVWLIDLQEQEKRRREQAVVDLETVNSIARTVSQSLELDEILATALDETLHFLEFDGRDPWGAVFLVGEDAQTARLLAGKGALPELTLPSEMLRLLAETDDVLFSGQLAGTGPWEAWVAVPLRARDRLLGLMIFELQERALLSQRTRRMLVAIGGQVGMAVENARLYENLRFYTREITRAQESERKRIAQELHDDTIQVLIAISRRMEALSDLPEPAVQRLVRLQELISQALRDLRLFVQDLRPPVLDHLGLVAALQGLVDDLAREGTAAELSVEGATRRLLPEIELLLFRIAQEALSNVRRHANAAHAEVRVVFQPDRVRLVIADDGCGFDAPTRAGDLVSTGRLGLIGMHERARTAGGTLTIESALGQGTTIAIDVSLAARPSLK